MTAETLDYIRASERMVGKAHSSLADTLNRGLRDMLAKSGYDPDAAFTGLFGPVHSAGAYGAVGDDSTDNTTAIAAALTAIGSAGGGVLTFGPGTFRISAALTVPANTRIQGMGKGLTTVKQVTSDTRGFNSTADNVQLLDLTVQGDGSAAGVGTNNGDALYVAGASAAAPTTGLLCVRVAFKNWSRSGVSLEFVNDITIRDCEFYDIKTTGISALSALRGRIHGCKIDTIGAGVDTYGVILSRTNNDSLVTKPNCADWLVTGNIVRNVTYWEGLDTHSGQRIVFADNEIYGCFIGVAVVDGRNGSAVATFAAADILIDNNNIDSGLTTGAAGAGIVFSGASSSARATGVIRGNTVRGHGDQTSNTSGGIVLTYARVDVQGGRLDECSPHGVVCFTDTDDCTVKMVTVTDPWSSTGGITVPSAVRVNDVSGTVEVTGCTLLRGSKSATSVCVNGVSTTGSGITVSGWGNEFSDAVTAEYSDGSTTTKRTFSVRGPIKGRGLNQSTRTVTAASDSPTSDDCMLLCDAASNSITINLPAVASNTGMVLFIKRIDGSATNTVTLDPNSAETIDGLTTVDLPTQRQAVILYCDGTTWRTFAQACLGDVADTTAQTGTYTIAQNIRTVFADATGGAFTVTVPAASVNKGRRFTVIKIDSTASAITVARTSPNTINGATSVTLTAQYEAITIESNGTHWHIVG